MAYNFSEVYIDVVKSSVNITTFAGLLPFVSMWDAIGMSDVINANLDLRQDKGYSDSDHVKALILMQLAGGEVPEHLKVFKEKFDIKDFPFQVPSPSATRAWFTGFHDPNEDAFRKQGQVYIPKENAHLAGFFNIHLYVFNQAYTMRPLSTVTLDQDATFIETRSQNALYNYQGQTSYEALNLYCHEYDVVVGTQFRDGNVNPGYGQLEQLKRTLPKLPKGITKVQIRSDSAGYQVELMKYCAEGRDERFKVIDFVISCPMTGEFRDAVRQIPESEWKVLKKKVIVCGEEVMQESNQEWAEVAYAPQSLSSSKNGPEYRFLATREKFSGKMEETAEEKQLPIPELIKDLEKANLNLKKLHLTEMGGKVYKVFGMVTNRIEEDGEELIKWQRERCGKSEEIHRLLKDELGGGRVVSKNFGANAIWWNISVLGLSLNNLFKHNFLPKEAEKSRPKTLRYIFYTQVGILIKHARRLILRIKEGMVSKWFEYAREKLMSFRAVGG
jgi:hypothetical protein